MEEQMQAGGVTVIEVQDKIKNLEKEINDLLVHFIQDTKFSPIVGVIRLNRDIIKITVQL